MLMKTPTRERIRELARDAFEQTGGGGDPACELMEKWLRADDELMRIIADDALRSRVLLEISIYARRTREQIKRGGETSMGAPLSPTVLSSLAATSMLLRDLSLPIPGLPKLSEATCADVWTAIDYKQQQIRPAQTDIKWWKLILAGRDRIERKALTRKHTETMLKTLLEKAERDASK